MHVSRRRRPRALAALWPLLFLAGCGLADPDTRYPVSPDQAKQAGNTYATPREVHGSLIDIVPAAAKTLGSRETRDPAAPRLGWRVYGDADGAEPAGEAGLPADREHAGERATRTVALAPRAVGDRGVRSALWRAALDAVATMPIRRTDPEAGVILTDWYTLPRFPDQRVKVGIYLVGDRLTRESFRISVVRQVRDARGNWQDAPAAPDSILELERRILARAAALLAPARRAPVSGSRGS